MTDRADNASGVPSSEDRCSRCGQPYEYHAHSRKEAVEEQRSSGLGLHAFRSQPPMTWPDGEWDGHGEGE